MTVRAYIAVEGPHDVAFVAELLRPLGLSRVQRMASLDPYWARLVPRTYPHNDDLLARVPIPLFLAGGDRSVAVHGVSGVTELVRRTEESLALLDGERPAVAAILDADTQQSAVARFEALARELRKLNLAIPDQPGVVSEGRISRSPPADRRLSCPPLPRFFDPPSRYRYRSRTTSGCGGAPSIYPASWRYVVSWPTSWRFHSNAWSLGRPDRVRLWSWRGTRIVG